MRRERRGRGGPRLGSESAWLAERGRRSWLKTRNVRRTKVCLDGAGDLPPLYSGHLMTCTWRQWEDSEAPTPCRPCLMNPEQQSSCARINRDRGCPWVVRRRATQGDKNDELEDARGCSSAPGVPQTFQAYSNPRASKRPFSTACAVRPSISVEFVKFNSAGDGIAMSPQYAT